MGISGEDYFEDAGSHCAHTRLLLPGSAGFAAHGPRPQGLRWAGVSGRPPPPCVPGEQFPVTSPGSAGTPQQFCVLEWKTRRLHQDGTKEGVGKRVQPHREPAGIWQAVAEESPAFYLSLPVPSRPEPNLWNLLSRKDRTPGVRAVGMIVCQVAGRGGDTLGKPQGVLGISGMLSGGASPLMKTILGQILRSWQPPNTKTLVSWISFRCLMGWEGRCRGSEARPVR